MPWTSMQSTPINETDTDKKDDASNAKTKDIWPDSAINDETFGILTQDDLNAETSELLSLTPPKAQARPKTDHQTRPN